LLCRRATSEWPKVQSSLKRHADVFGQDDLPGRIGGNLRRWRRNRQENWALVWVASIKALPADQR
jgi:hypothetical protein